MILRALSIEDMEPIRKWRNSSLHTLRTPFELTAEQQEEWYRNEICNRNSRSRFYAVCAEMITHNPIESIETTELVGYGGIENIQWENRIGEISLLINPTYRGHGVGTSAAVSIINRAFNDLNLHTVYAECYENNQAIAFWRKVYNAFGGTEAYLPNRKYHAGKYYGSVYFSASREVVL